MSHLTRPTSLLAGVLAAVVLLTGCGAGDAEEAEQTSAAETPPASSSAAKTPPASSSAPSPTASPASAEPSASITQPPAPPPPPPPDPRFGMPQVGQCFAMSYRQTRAPVSIVKKKGCRSPHTTVVAYARTQRKALTAATPLSRRRAVAAQVCRPAFERVVGGTDTDRATTVLTWVFFTPSAAQLERGARWVRCDVIARSGESLVPLPSGTPLLSGGVTEELRVCQTTGGIDVSCARPHAFRVDAVYLAEGDTYPDPQTYTTVARDRCKELMGRWGGYYQPPSRLGWRRGDHVIRCLSPTGS